MKPIISVDRLGKQYRIGSRTSYKTLRESIINLITTISSKTDAVQTIWALKDVSFEVKEGEVLGIIGRNGAGKSTLLKILSRITGPSEGEVRIRGRVASLLEVGTGFHPELTGRENIYLNGAVLGMRKAEIKKKFDEIVEFAEIETYLDTPVKRYSSGMYVRLAFAVAAHLEPEILIVDEVLAVGDAQFQKKCLGKMRDVSYSGRTVLFVSHNMAAVRSLCQRVMLYKDGRCDMQGKTEDVIERYLYFDTEIAEEGQIAWNDTSSAPGGRELSLRAIRLLSPEGSIRGVFSADKKIQLEVYYHVKKPLHGLRIVFHLLTQDGETAFASTDHNCQPGLLKPGLYKSVCVIPERLLNTREYIIRIGAGVPGERALLPLHDYMKMSVLGSGDHGSYYTEKWPGVVSPKLSWKIFQLEEDDQNSHDIQIS